MPTRQDVDIARAAIDRGFLTVKESIDCLKIQRDYEQSGQVVALETIFVKTNLLTEAQVESLKDSLARSAALRHIGEYEIVNKVGAGGMGTVYKANDKKANRVVALKVLSPAHVSNRDYIQRFLREAHASGRLSHPNIVQGYDAGEANGQYYFAMEFIDGSTVADMLKEGRPIPEQQSLDIAIQIAKALQHAEENGLVHRDIKPDNIMITTDGTAKLADLGLARLTSGDAFVKEQKSFGTVYYSSPEQCQNAEDIDSKSDMYSFGATLFHMLAGRVPFDGDAPEIIMHKHLREKPPYLKDINVQLSHGVSKVVRKLMAKHKKDRYPSMADVVKDLTIVRMGRSPRLGERKQDGSDYRYRTATGTWRTKRPPIRTVYLVAACIGVGVIMIIIGILVMRGMHPKPTERPTVVVHPEEKAARPMDEILFDEIVANGRTLNKLQYWKALRDFAGKYPNTGTALKATNLAREVARQIEDEAAPIAGEYRDRAVQLANAKRYQAALDALNEFDRYKYEMTRFPDEFRTLEREIRRAADADFAQVRALAERFIAQKNYQAAAGLYLQVKDLFAIPSIVGQCDEEFNRVQMLFSAEYQRQLQESQHVETEKQKAAEQVAAQKAAAFVDTLNAAKALAANNDFPAAAAKLREILKLDATDEQKESADRIAGDLDKAQQMINELKKTDAKLGGTRFELQRKNGEKVRGSIFRISQSGVSMMTRAGTVQSIPWNDLAPLAFGELLQLQYEGNFLPAERYARAAIALMCGKADVARAELKNVTEAVDQPSVASRLKDIDLFNPPSDSKQTTEPAAAHG